MTQWGFADAGDAAAYLTEVKRLWGAWIVGLAALMFSQGWLVIVAGVGAIGLLLFFARPLQIRAAAIVPEDTLVGSRFNVVGKGTARDRVLKQLAYGQEPLEEAVGLTGGHRWLLGARRVMISATIVAFVYVMATTFSGPA